MSPVEGKTAEQGPAPERRVVATFTNQEQAEQVAGELREQRGAVTIGAREDHVAAVGAEQREEAEGTIMGPGNFGPMTKSQNRGVVTLVPILAIAGAAIMALITYFVWNSTTGAIWGGIIGAVAGATLGFVAGGAFAPKYLDEPRLAAEEGVTISLDATDPNDAERLKDALRRKGAMKAFVVATSGGPLRPSSEDAVKHVTGE
jgi:hypothetical protein